MSAQEKKTLLEVLLLLPALRKITIVGTSLSGRSVETFSVLEGQETVDVLCLLLYRIAALGVTGWGGMEYSVAQMFLSSRNMFKTFTDFGFTNIDCDTKKVLSMESIQSCIKKGLRNDGLSVPMDFSTNNIYRIGVVPTLSHYEYSPRVAAIMHSSVGCMPFLTGNCL
ncbi:hypothetical protein DFH11DRAFT_450902 [Phellopilus nigrolimitatus]|nr:hypothetical protein DFH11DRAFT_450902 [Phellopilus nigrolimitatus]